MTYVYARPTVVVGIINLSVDFLKHNSNIKHGNRLEVISNSHYFVANLFIYVHFHQNIASVTVRENHRVDRTMRGKLYWIAFLSNHIPL